MRIACIYLPSFPLQAALSRAARTPDERERPLAVASRPAVGAPQILACSPSAWAAGIRPTMTASVAHALVGDLHCLIAEPKLEQELLGAVGDALLAISPRVDLGGAPRGAHHCIYVEVPSRRRGAWFGGRMAEVLAVFGLRGQIGIADDRFTAFIAASSADPLSASNENCVAPVPGIADTHCVPRGGSAAFLAPQPLSRLALAPEVQHVLEALGVRTLGAFAALPPPSVARSIASDCDYQALARGDGGADFDTYAPTGPVVEHAELSRGSIGLTIERLAVRLRARLDGRGNAAELTVRLRGPSSELTRIVALEDLDAQSLAEGLGELLGNEPWQSIEIVATPDGETSPDEMPCDSLVTAPPITLPAVAAGSAATPFAGLFGTGNERAEHRRTRRGKQRPRIAIGQARLFASD